MSAYVETHFFPISAQTTIAVDYNRQEQKVVIGVISARSHPSRINLVKMTAQEEGKYWGMGVLCDDPSVYDIFKEMIGKVRIKTTDGLVTDPKAEAMFREPMMAWGRYVLLRKNIRRTFDEAHQLLKTSKDIMAFNQFLAEQRARKITEKEIVPDAINQTIVEELTDDSQARLW